ncbi:hypothetical protein FQA39_LY01213 [Lamprigera yunnana]|nr:hypothetical protein FQA39_LY01213 [Lamprigera yunnana]
MSVLDKDFLPWAQLSSERLERELLAQQIFVPAKCTHYPLSLNIPKVELKKLIKIPDVTPKQFIPGKMFTTINVKSALNKWQHANCLKALQMYRSEGANKIDHKTLDTYKSLQTVIQQENVEFLQHAKQAWQEIKQQLEIIKPHILKYATVSWQLKLQKVKHYPQFYTLHDSICLVYHDPDNHIEVAFKENIFNCGTPHIPLFPTLLSKFTLNTNTLPNLNRTCTLNSKLPVSQDKNIENALENHGVDVIISMSGIKRLMDDSDNKSVWNLPIVIKQIKFKLPNEDVQEKKVVFIDKALPLQTPTRVDFNQQCHKRLVRLNLSKPKTDSAANMENSINSYMTEDAGSNNISDSTLDNSLEGNDNLHQHNVIYSTWNINFNDKENVLLKSKKQTKNIRFLLRQKVDAYQPLPDGNQRPITLVPKMEHQLEYGAALATKSELMRQWCDLFFRPFSHLYRIRLHAIRSEVVQLEEVSLQKVNNEAMHNHQFKPYERLGALFTTFSKLIDLECGNYLLHHNSQTEGFVEILKAVYIINNAKFDLHKDYDVNKCSIASTRDIPWYPIDVNYILPEHNVYKRMPGMFKPTATILNQKGKTGMKKKNKKNKKNNKKNSNVNCLNKSII